MYFSEYLYGERDICGTVKFCSFQRYSSEIFLKNFYISYGFIKCNVTIKINEANKVFFFIKGSNFSTIYLKRNIVIAIIEVISLNTVFHFITSVCQ